LEGRFFFFRILFDAKVPSGSHSLRGYGSSLFTKERYVFISGCKEEGPELRFPWPFPKQPSSFYNMISYFTIGSVATVSKLLFIRVANELVVHNKERFMNIWMDKSRPLITISNHRSNMDDPLMWSFITTREMCRNIQRHRYTLAAHNICFTKPLHTRFFSLGRCVPCVRGEGVYQKGMDFCVEKLNENGWVHMFPEGRVTMEPLRSVAFPFSVFLV
ncbi:Acyltransferase, partial [Cooperia oncophora]